MFVHLRQLFVPPVFDDPDQTRTARVLHVLLVYGILSLAFLGLIAVPFLFGAKLYNTLILLALIVTWAAAYRLMRRGQVQAASALFLSATGVVLTIVLFFAGGTITIPAAYYVSGTVIAGLLLGTRAAMIHAGACSLAGLVHVALGASDYALPRVFPLPPLASWVDLSGSLLLTTAVLVLTLSSLKDALALARRRLDERERAEQALLASETRYRGLFEGVPVGLYRTTPAGEIVDANSALVEMLGYPDKASLLAARVPDIFLDDEVRERWQALIEREGTVRGFELQMRRHDGTPVWISETAHTVRSPEGRVITYQGSLEDITERKKAEQERERLQERLIQVQKTEAIGRLAGGIAHDFNNVLMAVQGYGRFLLDNLSSADPQDWPPVMSMRADLGAILEASDRAAALTRQLLAYSRKQVLQPRVLNLNDLLRGMENMLGRLIGEDIALLTALAPDLGRVLADPGQVEQVVMNLAVNARDAMPHGGRLRFETANVELDEAFTQAHSGIHPGRYALLAVSDNGTGMSDEVKARIFEPFFTTKEQGRGTGLGLATVYGIVEQSGGHIEVYSEVGAGTTFKVYLPLTEEVPVASVASKAAARMPSGVETILLVEDEPSVRELVRRVLIRCGYTVLVAGHPHEALALSTGYSGDVHLLITDVVMPDMSGRGLAERLASSRPEMKVLYISGYTDDAILDRGVLESGVAYLGKPFTPTRLAHKVREVLVD